MGFNGADRSTLTPACEFVAVARCVVAPALIRLREPRTPGDRLRSCPPSRSTGSPPLLHSAGHPPPSAATVVMAVKLR